MELGIAGAVILVCVVVCTSIWRALHRNRIAVALGSTYARPPICPRCLKEESTNTKAYTKTVLVSSRQFGNMTQNTYRTTSYELYVCPRCSTIESLLGFVVWVLWFGQVVLVIFAIAGISDAFSHSYRNSEGPAVAIAAAAVAFSVLFVLWTYFQSRRACRYCIRSTYELSFRHPEYGLLFSALNSADPRAALAELMLAAGQVQAAEDSTSRRS